MSVYAYACRPVVEALGPEWVEQGWARFRFVAPCHDGEKLVVTVGSGAAGPLTVEVRSGERLCAVGSVSVAADPGSRAPAIPEGALPAAEERPQAGKEVFVAGRLLGSLELATDHGSMERYLAAVGDPSSLYRERGWLHPGLLLSGANWVLGANVVMRSWLHVGSEVHHFRAACVGERVQVRARVAESFERKGHSFAVVDVEWVGTAEGGAAEVIAAGRHTAIWRIAGA